MNNLLSGSMPKETTTINNTKELNSPSIVGHEEMKSEPLQVKIERVQDLPQATLMENKMISTSTIKTEPEWDHSEVKYLSGDTLCEWDKPEPILIVRCKGQMTHKNEECVLALSDQTSGTTSNGMPRKYSSRHLTPCGRRQSVKQRLKLVRYNELLPKNAEVVVKTETSGETETEISFVDCKIKHEDVDLKREDSEQNNISMSSEPCNPEKCYGYRQHKCHLCDFKTKREDHLEHHILRHRNPKQVDLLKCDKCDYRTPVKRYLNRHMLIHNTNKEEDLLRCDECEYRTHFKQNLKRHILIHKNAEEVGLFTCDKCEYQTHIKDYLKKHISIHKTSREVNLLTCSKCEYRTHIKSNLKRHLVIHKNTGKVDLSRCDKCKYRTFIKGNLKKHLFRHENIEEVDSFRCDTCEYRTHNKSNLMRHLEIHKNTEEVDLFRCDKCEYRTHIKHYLKRHVIKHKTPRDLFCCSRCKYKTHLRRALNRHLMTHKKS